MKAVDRDMAEALETLCKVLGARFGAQDIVVCVRCDGRAEIDFTNAHRQWIGPQRRFVDAAGWFEIEGTEPSGAESE